MSSAAGGTAVAPPPPAITLTDKALDHLKKLRSESGSDKMLLRIGVKSGGCSGKSVGAWCVLYLAVWWAGLDGQAVGRTWAAHTPAWNLIRAAGMSYMMEFEEEANVKPADSVMHYEGFKLVCDAKSLLYLFGMSLDYSNALIGEVQT